MQEIGLYFAEVMGLVLAVFALVAILRLFKISDTLDQILQELRKRP
jgi:hypothetical protein